MILGLCFSLAKQTHMYCIDKLLIESDLTIALCTVIREVRCHTAVGILTVNNKNMKRSNATLLNVSSNWSKWSLCLAEKPCCMTLAVMQSVQCKCTG